MPRYQFYIYSCQITVLCRPLLKDILEHLDCYSDSWVTNAQCGSILLISLEKKYSWMAIEIELMLNYFKNTAILSKKTMAPFQLLNQWIGEVLYRSFRVLISTPCMETHSKEKADLVFRLCYKEPTRIIRLHGSPDALLPPSQLESLVQSTNL